MSEDHIQPTQHAVKKANKGKIIMIYVCVAIICSLLIAAFVFIGSKSQKKMSTNTERGSQKAIEIQVMSMEESIGLHDIVKLDKDLTATNQDGVEVNLQSLEGKVWVFAQFYGSCPECNKINLGILKDLYTKYKSNSNFHIVTISIMEEEDGVKSMQNMAQALSAESNNWWFLTGDVEEVNAFCSENMLYSKFQPNTNKEGEGMQGEILHDMGMAVFNPEMIMKAKVDVYSQLAANNTVGAELKKKQLDLEIAAALKTIETIEK